MTPTSSLLLPRLLPLGDGAWTLEWGDAIDPAIHERVMALERHLAQARSHQAQLRGVTDVVPTFRSLTVLFDPLVADAQALGQFLLSLAGTNKQDTLHTGRQWRLPVCFDEDFAPDLDALCHTRGLSREAAINRVLATTFRVYMLGFQPGFPYMGGLPEILRVPRLSSPRQRVPARSVAVAAEMCAVYPWESPGGWNLIGRTPVVLFDLRVPEQPALLTPGDSVRWYAVCRSAYDALCRDLSSGLPRESFLLHTPT